MTYIPWIFIEIILLVVLGCIAGAQAAEPCSFYNGKTMHLIVSTSPGGATDIAGRLVARTLGKYIPGQPRVERGEADCRIAGIAAGGPLHASKDDVGVRRTF